MSLRALLSGILCAVLAIPVRAEETEAFAFFEEEAQVVTASRRAQPLQESPVTIDVITAQEIEDSQALGLWDLLRFRVGMDVLEGRSLDGTRAVVSVRGFPGSFVSSLQVLVDGRSVYSAFQSGVFWQQLPVQIQDIERIEIVRGPNAALYGSNAALGVINIITRKPSRNKRTSVAALGGSRGIRRIAVAADNRVKKFRYRISHTYRTQNGFPRISGGVGNDFLHSNKLNFRGLWAPSERAALEILGGSSWDSLGGAVGDHKVTFASDFVMFRYTQATRGTSSWEVLGARKELTRKLATFLSGSNKDRTYQYDLEGLYRTDLFAKRWKLTSGASLRHAVTHGDQVFRGNPRQKNQILRGFIHQSLKLSPPLTFAGAVSLEDSSTGGTQPAFQAALLGRMKKQHVLRVSYSRAPTIPSLVTKHADVMISPNQAFIGNPDIKPEKIEMYELGYQGTYLSRRLRAGANLFYMKNKDMGRAFVKSISFPPLLTVLSSDNANEAISRGVELDLRFRLGAGRSVYLNYTQQRITDRLGIPNVSLSTPKNKINLGGVVALVRGFSLGVDAGYKSAHTFDSVINPPDPESVPAYWRLDARVIYRPRPGYEFFVAGKNLFEPRRKEFIDGLEVPRLFYAGLTIQFDWGP